jgi:cupin 2 domain-containing protein
VPSLFDSLPDASPEEAFTTLLDDPAVRIERIVSHGHASPEGFWYDQSYGEWVLVVRGGATLRLESPDERIVLKPGDYVWLPPGRRHRVEATDAATIWLAVHVLNMSRPAGQEA